jgi:small-conductance mechanosensitive channel
LGGLALHASLQNLLSLAWAAVLTLFGVRFILHAIRYSLVDQWGHDRPGPVQGAKALLPVLQVMIWVLGLIFFLDNAGVKISAVVTGLGIGGVAVALAAQSVLGDLFSHIAILFDRPFVIGDFIVVDSLMGTVEHLGIKTTRVRSLSGELLIFPNTALTSARIRNYQHMDRRRVAFNVGFAQDTPSDKLKEVPGLLREAVKRVPGTVLERAHFVSFDPSGLNFEVVYFIQGADHTKFMDIQQDINFALKEAFDRRALSLTVK